MLNGIGITGVNWQVGLVALRSLDSSWGTSADVAAGFAYAGQLGLPVVNASLGGSERSMVMSDAIRLAPRTLFVFAAGNEGEDVDPGGTPISYPCAEPFDNVICVAATGNQDDLAFFSNWGADSVDIAAPGNMIHSTVPRYGTVSNMPGWSTSSTHPWTSNPGPPPALVSPEPVADMDSRLISDEVDLETEKGCVLVGTIATDVPPSEGIVILERTINGGLDWHTLGYFTGSTEGRTYDLDEALKADGEPYVAVRFRLLTASIVTPARAGVSLQGSHIVCMKSPVGNGAYASFSGTSMASPHVAGAAALLLSKRPDLTTAQLREALLGSARPVSTLAGKMTTGGTLDLPGALAAIEPEEPGPPTPPTPPAPPVTPNPPATSDSPTAALKFSVEPIAKKLKRAHGLIFKATANQNADVTAHAVIRWKGGKLRLSRLSGGAASTKPKARLAGAGRFTTLRLRAKPGQLRRLLKAQNSGKALRANLVVRATNPDLKPAPAFRRNLRLR